MGSISGMLAKEFHVTHSAVRSIRVPGCLGGRGEGRGAVSARQQLQLGLLLGHLMLLLSRRQRPPLREQPLRAKSLSERRLLRLSVLRQPVC